MPYVGEFLPLVQTDWDDPSIKLPKDFPILLFGHQIVGILPRHGAPKKSQRKTAEKIACACKVFYEELNCFFPLCV